MSVIIKSKWGVGRKYLLVAIFLLLFIMLLTIFLLGYRSTIDSIKPNSPPEVDPFFESKTSLQDAIYVKSEAELRAAIQNAPNNTPITIALDNDITLTNGSIGPYINQDVTLTSNRESGFYKLIGAKELSQTYLGMTTPYATVAVGGVLRLDGVVVTHAEGILGEGVFVGEGGTFIMYDGEISGNNNPLDYLGHGAVIGDGGGVYNRMGVFVLFGGEISGNAAYSGGGVHNFLGDFIMYGGTISSNNASGMFALSSGIAGGGGVYNGGGTFIMWGGTLSDNKAEYSGGGVHDWGNFTMYGGTISANKAKFGGGVRNFYGNFTMLDGIISGNHADYGGGGVSCDSFTMYGGTISDNHAGSRGGGVYVSESGSFTMLDGIISGNHADDSGSGVYGTVKKFGGTIYNNRTEDNNTNASKNNNSLGYAIVCVCVVVMVGVVVFLYFKIHGKRKNN